VFNPDFGLNFGISPHLNRQMSTKMIKHWHCNI